MASYEEVREALEALWAGELAEIQEKEAARERAIHEARERLAALRSRVADRRGKLHQLHEELDGLPDRLGRAQLAGDEAAVLELQGRYAALTEEIAGVEAQKEEAETELDRLGGDSYVERVAFEHSTIGLRSSYERRVKEEYAALRELLEDARGRALGPRSHRDRIRAEETAARERRASAESRQAYGLGEPSRGIRVLSN